ncbi:MAG: helix-turn-helix domain-containing protein [Sphingomonadales bacterium]
MSDHAPRPLDAFILALPETAGSALYGMVDVLASTGTIWRDLAGQDPGLPLIRPRIVSPLREPFQCGNGIPVQPELSLAEATAPGIVILPEMWLGRDDPLAGRHQGVRDWVLDRHAAGACVYSACSGAVLLASTGLLDGREATSHWGYQDLFRRHYPRVRFNPQPNLVFADQSGRIVTAGGTTSWHDLALHIIARHISAGEALRIAKVYLLKWHTEGQLPYTNLVRAQPHADAAVRRAEDWLADHLCDAYALAGATAASGIPARSLKRRFRVATGMTMIGYLQNLRIEEAKRLLEDGLTAVDDVAPAVGYENAAFFRRIFRRATGLQPGHYRRMFSPFMPASAPA